MAKHKKRSTKGYVGIILGCLSLITAALVASPASADVAVEIHLGPGQYALKYSKPTGTLTVGGGTISARCSASALKGLGSPQLTPTCTTRTTTCPVTATSCSVVLNIQENALRGPVSVGGIAHVDNGWTNQTVLQPYSCPKPNSCGTRIQLDGVQPGSGVFLIVANLMPSTGPSVFAQTTMTVH